MKRPLLTGAFIAVVAVGVFWATSNGQPKSGPEPKAPVGIAAIEETSAAYTAAFNRGDLAAVASFWAENADYVADDGTITRGRTAITELFKAVVKTEGGAKLTLKTSSLRMLGDSVALHDGTVELTSPEGDVSKSQFTAVWTKIGGKWLLERARDIAIPTEDEVEGPYTKLKELEWLVGTWTAREGTTEVSFQCRWNRTKTFLILEQQVKLNVDDVLTVTKVVGWDPINENIRTWMFDSTGGFGEGVWARQGNTWNVEASGVTSEGKTASSVNAWKFIDDDSFEWSATDRQIDGAPAADVRLKFIRTTIKK